MTLPFTGGLLLPMANMLVNDFGLGGLYQHNKSDSGGGTATVILTVKTDGTWAITFAAGTATAGTPLTGTWLIAGGLAADHEVIFAVTDEVNTPTVTNDAATYTAITVNRRVEISKINADASATVAPSIRRIGTGAPVLTDSTSFQANGTP